MSTHECVVLSCVIVLYVGLLIYVSHLSMAHEQLLNQRPH